MRWIAVLAVTLGLAAGSAQFGRRTPRDQEKDEIRLPDGKSQKQEIIKADHKKSQADAAELLTLAQEVQSEMAKGPYQVVDMRLIKKVEEIEKLARNIKNRMKRY